MGRIKELKDKAEKGELSESEKKELEDLLAEAKDATPDPEPDEGEGEEDAEAEVDKLAERFVDKVTPMVDKLDSVLEAINKHDTPDVKVKSESKFIVDKQLGRVPVEKLDEVIIELPERKQAGKKFTSVTKRTVEFFNALLTGDKQKLQVLVEGTAALGGNLVPQEFANIIVEDRRDAVVMRDYATVLQLQTDTLNLPTLDTRPHVAWRSEAAVKSTSTVQWGNITLTPYSLAAIVPLSNELVADASQGVGGSIVSYVARLLTRAIVEEEETQFWTGNGSGRPTGIDNYSFTTISGGLTDATRADAYKTAYFRLPQGYRNTAVWAANASTWARAATLKDSQGNYLLQRLGDSPIPTIMGRPAREVAALGDGKVFFGDFSYYYIGEREGIAVDTSTEATVASQSAFERNLTFVRVEERVDGELALTRAVVELSSMGGAF